MRAINPENRKPPSNAKQIPNSESENLLRFVFLTSLTESQLRRLKFKIEANNISIKKTDK